MLSVRLQNSPSSTLAPALVGKFLMLPHGLPVAHCNPQALLKGTEAKFLVLPRLLFGSRFLIIRAALDAYQC